MVMILLSLVTPEESVADVFCSLSFDTPLYLVTSSNTSLIFFCAEAAEANASKATAAMMMFFAFIVSIEF